MLLERQDRQHGAVAGGADRHALARAPARRHLGQPARLDPGALGEATPPALTDAPAVDQHSLADRERRIGAGGDPAGEIHPRHMRKVAHQGRPVQDDQAILVVQGRIVDLDQDLALRQGRVLDSLDAGRDRLALPA